MDASPSQVYSQHYVLRYLFIHLGGKCLAQERNAISLARVRTRTNHEATAPHSNLDTLAI